METLRVRALGQGGVFTPSDVATAGISRSRARTLLARGDWVALRRGVYTLRATVEHCALDGWRRHALLTAAALAVVGEQRVAAGLSAAGGVHGLDLLGPPPRRVTLGLPRDAPGEPAGAGHGYRCGPRTLVNRMPDCEQERVFGLPTLSPARAAVDVARSSPLAAGVVALDAVARQFGVTRELLDEVVTRQRGWPGARRLRTALELMDTRSESVLETLGRLSLRHTALPRPVCQAWVGEHGPECRVDFLIPGVWVVGEGDGRLKYSDPDALWREKRRQERIEELGGTVVRFDWAQANRPQALADRFVAAARRASAAGPDRVRLRVFADPDWWTEDRRRSWDHSRHSLPWWLRGLAD